MLHHGNVTRIAVSWSSGKDSAWMLHLLRQQPGIEVVALVTTFNAEADRVALHAVRRSLVERQADAVGIPLWPVPLPWPCSNAAYEAAMRDLCERAIASGIAAMAFGDLFLTEIREYRERQLAGTGLEPLFPLWNLPTAELASEMIRSGLRARLTCVDPKALPRSFAGREFETSLLADLPATVDPCGENGEFHTFAWAGPMFREPIAVTAGPVVEYDGFVFADLIPAGG
jgi:uncharacterized protein (TIGR00290 family)